MKASISFPELQNLIKEKSNQSISLGCVDGRTVRVTYPFSLGFIKKDISADVIIKEMRGSDLLLQVSAGLGTGTMLTTVLNMVKDRIPEGLLEKKPDNHILLHLDQIEQLEAVFEKIEVNDIRVLGEGLEVEGNLK